MKIEVSHIDKNMPANLLLECIAAELITLSYRMVREKKKKIPVSKQSGEDVNIKIVI